MRIAILIEGRNFFSGWKRTAPNHLVDAKKLIQHIADTVGATSVASTTYYTGVDQMGRMEADVQVKAQHLTGQLQAAGAVLKTYPLKTKHHACPLCKGEIRYVVEKEVDTAMTIDALNLCDDEAIDGIVFVTNDLDVKPLVDELKDADLCVWLAAWTSSPISPSFTAVIDGTVEFGKTSPFLYQDSNMSDENLMLREIERAEKKFAGGYVGMHFFLNKWTSDKLSLSPERRSNVLNALIENGSVTLYEAHDGNKAIKCSTSAGTSVEAQP
jgi:uncharacterized LabA/DUF88 family protein